MVSLRALQKAVAHDTCEGRLQKKHGDKAESPWQTGKEHGMLEKQLMNVSSRKAKSERKNERLAEVLEF